MGIIVFDKPITGNFIVDIMVWLVSITSSITVGVVLFTLILKLITLPFDFVSRASMRRNSVKMEEMRPELEKLQKQYADNKELYNQKMMALYKKNGYSMFGACLPTILTLVIFIVALNGFTAYSQFKIRENFYAMTQSYNNVVYAGIEEDGEYIVRNQDYSIVLGDAIRNDIKVVSGVPKFNDDTTEKEYANGVVNAKVETIVSGELTSYKLVVDTDTSYISVTQNFYITNGAPVWGGYEYNTTSIKQGAPINEINNNLLDKNGNGLTDAYALALQTAFDAEIAKATAESPAPFSDINEFKSWLVQNDNELNYLDSELIYTSTFINSIQSEMAAKTYVDGQEGFLWIKNIWITDSPTAHPLESNWANFKRAAAYNGTDVSDANYDLLTANLSQQKTEPNGYYILVVLTAGMSFLMQFVMNKSQKAQMELQTVDGQGAQTQKVMMWMMPIMMAIFAFMYTSAFSIYIILSNILSIGTTFLINFLVDKKIKKEKAMSGEGNNTTVRGRVYVPKEEPQQNVKDKKKEKANSKGKVNKETGDFLSGTADNKKKNIRGRIK